LREEAARKGDEPQRGGGKQENVRNKIERMQKEWSRVRTKAEGEGRRRLLVDGPGGAGVSEKTEGG